MAAIAVILVIGLIAAITSQRIWKAARKKSALGLFGVLVFGVVAGLAFVIVAAWAWQKL
jgi:uncharacterized membrane-anchored protein